MRLHFAGMTFDADTRQLLRGSAEVHLSPKAFELLKVLVENRPRALSKHELHEHLWPATFVSEANLASLIAEVREALQDPARHSRFIRTANRFGYAFCGEETPAETAPTPELASFCWLLRNGRRMPLRPGENILGREDDGVWIDSATVSRRHARIVISGGEAILEDLGSKNGTFLGGERVLGPVRLKDGDEVRTGSAVFRFRMIGPKGATVTWSGSERH